MKKIMLIMVICWCAKVSGKDNVRLHGRITNPISDSIRVSYALTSIAYQPVGKAVKLDGQGRFNFEFTVPNGFTYIRLVHGNQETRLCVQPETDLQLTLDAINFDSTIRYEGKGKELANFTARYVLESPTMGSIEAQGQMACKEDVATFEHQLKKLEENEMAFLEKYWKDLPASFANYFEADCRYKAYKTMERYPWVHEMLKQKSMDVKDIPKENYLVIEDIPEAFNDSLLDIESYQSYVTNFFASRIACAMTGQNVPRQAWPSGDSILALGYARMPPKTAEFFAGQSIFQNLAHKPIATVETEYEEYKKHFPKSRNLEILRQQIEHKKNFATGKPAPDFEIVTPEGKKIKLSGLKGNVVYIDFWSRGCVPCLAEMPDAKKVREHFKDKPVTFVYISLDAEENVWKKAVKDYSVEGINTHVDNDWQSETVKNYGVSSIPSHFLVDKDGNFAASDDLARPSNSEKLTIQIEKLLK